MYNIKKIYQACMHVVGWEQDTYVGETIDPQLLQTESGLLFQHAHPLFTLGNVLSVKRAEEDLSEYMERLQRAGIVQAVQRFMEEKLIGVQTKNLLEKRTLFEGSGRINATTPNTHKLVGFEITPVRSSNVAITIDRIGLQFTGEENMPLTLYVFHSSSKNPIFTYELEVKNNGFYQWVDLENCVLTLDDDVAYNGGTWYIVYDQDQLQAKNANAINVNRDWSREPCGTCNMGSIEAYREITKYIRVSPFMVNAPTTFAEFPEMWDIAENIYTNTQNYGMNLQISVSCDLTNFIIQNRLSFANVFQKQVAYNFLRTLAMNPDVNVNRNQSNASRMDILYELDGNTQGRPSGLGYELERSYKALNIDISGLDKVCLSCHTGGVRYKST